MNNQDKRLLENAARAIGLAHFHWGEHKRQPVLLHIVDRCGDPIFVAWDPLFNSADALDLAVELELTLVITKGRLSVKKGDEVLIDKIGTIDLLTDTRRVIVEAAEVLFLKSDIPNRGKVVDLRPPKLTDADLRGADLRPADLKPADLRKKRFWFTKEEEEQDPL